MDLLLYNLKKLKMRLSVLHFSLYRSRLTDRCRIHPTARSAARTKWSETMKVYNTMNSMGIPAEQVVHTDSTMLLVLCFAVLVSNLMDTI